MRELPPADFKAVVRPNFDTLYSLAWLDLTRGPVVVSSAPVTDGRYFELPMYDMWTDEFAVPGSRTTGTEAGHWAVVPPGWAGELPPGVDRIDSSTPYVWIIGRTQTYGPPDYAAVHAIQDGYSIVPLANWGGEAPPARAVTDESIDIATPPLLQMRAMKAPDFFTYGMRLLAMHPPHLTDWALIQQMRRTGLVANAEFGALDATVRSALEGAPEAGQQAMQEAILRIAHIVNGWQSNIDTIGVYGNFYMKRAVIAMLGLGSNEAADAVYPLLITDADGNAASGDNDYIMHFDADKLPPVRSFWSVTAYDADGYTLPMRSTDSRSAIVTHCATTATARLTSTSSTSTPARTSRRTGFPPPGSLRPLHAALPANRASPPRTMGTPAPPQTLKRPPPGRSRVHPTKTGKAGVFGDHAAGGAGEAEGDGAPALGGWRERGPDPREGERREDHDRGGRSARGCMRFPANEGFIPLQVKPATS